MKRALSSLIVLGAGLLSGPHSAAALPTGSACRPTLSIMVHGYGSPDDVAVRGGAVYFGDLTTNVLAVAQGGRVRVVARGLATPEGIVLRGSHATVVEQGRNRLDDINLTTGAIRVIRYLRNTTGKEGVDGIAAAPNGGIYVPDSPYGLLYHMDRRARLHLLTGGLSRPVDVVPYRGGLAVADENAFAVWLEQGGHLTRLSSFSTPDDLVVFHGALLTTTLGDGGLWEVAPHRRLLMSGFAQPQGMAVLDSSHLVIADSNHNALEKMSGVAACLS